ncbi:hypothetical protein CYMTET_50217 [Cymbomonas tetramitiformis]|uniref:Uncharacterized protein n=1 Tax=Cymbomonas tetramitiformis TaxID=36881 RepID=A0AAE0BQ83_9CHLO|nr:hypothetical protein CYMTET_50217 [Cymbomonas tetramitiformis]|eukprot:gene1697-2354_t
MFMLVLLRKRKAPPGNFVRNGGGPLTSAAKDMWGSITSAGDDGDLRLNTSKDMRIYGTIFTRTAMARTREVTNSFYTPLISPIDDSLQSCSISDRDVIQYLRTGELYVRYGGRAVLSK